MCFSEIPVEYLLTDFIIFFGGVGRLSKDYIGLQGEGGEGLGSPEKGLRNLLMVPYRFILSWKDFRFQCNKSPFCQTQQRLIYD